MATFQNSYTVGTLHSKDEEQLYVLVSSPDPALKEGKGLVHIECILRLLSEYSTTPIYMAHLWLSCDVML